MIFAVLSHENSEKQRPNSGVFCCFLLAGTAADPGFLWNTTLRSLIIPGKNSEKQQDAKWLPAPLAGIIGGISIGCDNGGCPKEAEGNMPVVRGSCLCGGVKYEITGPLMRSGHCHCSNCRKAHGAAFRSRARVRVEDFKWVQGEELVKYFESSPGFHRGFCGVCGSPIVNRPDRTPEFGIALGGLDDDPGVRPERHFFVASKAPWFEITDDLPQHVALPPRSEVLGA